MQSTEPSVVDTRAMRLWKEWRGFVLFIAIMLVFRSAVADWNNVPTGSMIPSILEGDRIVVDKLAYDLRVPFTLIRLARWSDPERSDVITFESPEDGRLLVKRVVGIPGDVVQMQDNRLLVNQQPASYAPVPPSALPPPIQDVLQYVQVETEQVLGSTRPVMTHRYRHPETRADFGPVEVPPGHYLVLGDNRDNSQDYRFIDFVDRELIVGKAKAIAFSLDYDNYYIPRSDRFFRDLE